MSFLFKFLPLLLIPQIHALSIRSDSNSNTDNDLHVKLSGGDIYGTISPSTPSVRQFLNIPYAEPPTGALRFAPPLPAKPFGTLHATSFGPACLQALQSGGAIPEFSVQGPVSEDCLSLSVWTPSGKTSADKLPVLIFIHGGGFMGGEQNTSYQIPAQWVQRTKSHVVVTINHRLNLMGFPVSSALKDLNVGLLDQRMAVAWVRDNIAQFGGDEERMVLWGQSAGSIFVAYYAFTYPQDPIVSGLIMDSGTETTLPTEPKPIGDDQDFQTAAKYLGCGSELGAGPQLECMRKVPEAKLQEFIEKSLTNSSLLTYPRPTVDEKVVFGDYVALAKSGRMAKIPAIIGTNAGERISLFLNLFLCPSWRTSNARLNANIPTFRYEYHGSFSNISPIGPQHSTELPLIFGTHWLYRGNSTDLAWQTSATMQDAWLAFTKDGVEGLKGTGWGLYDQTWGGKIRFFGDGTAVKTSNTALVEAQCPAQAQTASSKDAQNASLKAGTVIEM